MDTAVVLAQVATQQSDIGEILFPIMGMSLGALGMGIGVIAIVTEHRRKQKALDVLRTYAEKGIEPPQAVLDSLSGVSDSPAHRMMADTRRNHLSRAAFFLIMGLGFGGLFLWLFQGDRTLLFPFLLGFGICSFVMAAIALSSLVRGLLAPAGDER